MFNGISFGMLKSFFSRYKMFPGLIASTLFQSLTLSNYTLGLLSPLTEIKILRGHLLMQFR